MKAFLVMMFILAAGDLALFSGAYSVQLWSGTRTQLQSIQSYADDATGSLTRA